VNCRSRITQEDETFPDERKTSVSQLSLNVELRLNDLTTLNSMYNAVGSQLHTPDLGSNSWQSTI